MHFFTLVLFAHLLRKLMRYCRPLVSAALWALVMQNAYGAWHEQQPGSDVPVHYVRLKGHTGDNEQNRKLLLTEHQTCVARNTAFSRPYQPLDPSAVPPVPAPRDVEIYYAANRTLTVTQGVAYQIDFDTCALQQVTGRTLKLVSSIGRCDIDFSKKQAKGVCDTNAHAQSPSISHLTRPKPPPDTSPFATRDQNLWQYAMPSAPPHCVKY